MEIISSILPHPNDQFQKAIDLAVRFFLVLLADVCSSAKADLMSALEITEPASAGFEVLVSKKRVQAQGLSLQRFASNAHAFLTTLSHPPKKFHFNVLVRHLSSTARETLS